MNEEQGFQEWVNSRPPCVQKLIQEFPVGTRLQHDETLLYLLGYTEDDHVIMSAIDPNDDYDGAHAATVYICARHLREAVRVR